MRWRRLSGLHVCFFYSHVHMSYCLPLPMSMKFSFARSQRHFLMAIKISSFWFRSRMRSACKGSRAPSEPACLRLRKYSIFSWRRISFSDRYPCTYKQRCYHCKADHQHVLTFSRSNSSSDACLPTRLWSSRITVYRQNTHTSDCDRSILRQNNILVSYAENNGFSTSGAAVHCGNKASSALGALNGDGYFN
jgi:hypothetical protein